MRNGFVCSCPNEGTEVSKTKFFYDPAYPKISAEDVQGSGKTINAKWKNDVILVAQFFSEAYLPWNSYVCKSYTRNKLGCSSSEVSSCLL